METLLLDPMYDRQSPFIRQVVIHSQVVAKGKPPIYLGNDQTELANTIIAQDDDKLSAFALDRGGQCP